MDVIVGQTAPFTVHCFNGASPPVEIPDTNGAITVSVAAGSGTATCNPDGTNGVFTAGTTPGAVVLSATDGVLTSAPFTGFNVVPNPDTVPATLTITAP